MRRSRSEENPTSSGFAVGAAAVSGPAISAARTAITASGRTSVLLAVRMLPPEDGPMLLHGWTGGARFRLTAGRRAVGVQLDDIAVGIRDVDLRPRRQVDRRLEAGHAVRFQVCQRRLVAVHAQGEMAVAPVDGGRAAQRPRVLVLDQMQLLKSANRIPGAAKRHGGARQLDQPEHSAVEPLRPLYIG